MSRPECFGKSWADLPLETQAAVTERLRTESDYEALVTWLRTELELSEKNAKAVADTPAPEGFGRLGRSALTALIDALEKEVDDDGFVATEAEAAKRVYGRTNAETDPNRKGMDQMRKYQKVLVRHIPRGTGDPDGPYDQFMGRITNPTVQP